MSTDLQQEPFAVDPLTGFGSRGALLADLASAVDRAHEPSVFAVFGLDGLDEYEEAHGTAETNAVIAALAGEFARLVCPEGVCYAPRRREFCALFDLPFAAVSPILAAAAIAIRREGAIALVTAAFGIALLPHQADSPVGALVVADRRLDQARRAQRRARPVRG